MKKPTVEDALKKGIYGALETKPDERRKFLGTIRERIIVVLTKSQVREQKVYPQVEKYMKENPLAHLLLNGAVDYSHLSKYKKLALKYKNVHKIVTNQEHDSEIGLVLAMDHAIDKEDIYLKKSLQIHKQSKKSLLSKLFRRRG